jgi:hypothetical protein
MCEESCQSVLRDYSIITDDDDDDEDKELHDAKINGASP